MAEAQHTAHTEAPGAEHHVEATAFGNSLLTPGFFVALAMLTVFAIMLWKRVPALIATALDKKFADEAGLTIAARLFRLDSKNAEHNRKTWPQRIHFLSGDIIAQFDGTLRIVPSPLGGAAFRATVRRA